MVKDNLSINDEFKIRTSKGFNDGIFIDVNMHIELFDENGKLKEESYIHNTVTTAGKAGIADQILDVTSLSKMGWMAIGSGTPSGTLLGSELARVTLTSKTRLANVITVVGTFPAGTGTGTITEAGTFDVVTANTVNMWMSGSGFSHTKGILDSIVITWDLTIG